MVLSSFTSPWHFDHHWVTIGKLSTSVLGKRCFCILFMSLTGCILNLFGFSYGCSTFTFLVYSISYFPYLDKVSIFSRMSSYHPSTTGTCVGLREKDLKSFCCIVCFHCDVLKQSPLLFTNILSFSCFFFSFSGLLYFYFFISQFPISNFSAVRLRMVLFSFSLLKGCWSSPWYHRTILCQWLPKLSCLPRPGPHQGLCLFCSK